MSEGTQSSGVRFSRPQVVTVVSTELWVPFDKIPSPHMTELVQDSPDGFGGQVLLTWLV